MGLVCCLTYPFTAKAFPIAEPGTEGLKVIVSGTNAVVATYQGNSAGYSNDLYLDSPGGPIFVFNNHDSPVGSTFNFGSFAVGTELLFRLHVNDTGDDFFTGPADRNPDSQAHARVQQNWEPNTTLVSFEDAIDFAYNDLSFSFTNTATVILFALNVTKTGNGNVTSAPAGINCGTDCTENYTSNTIVALTATPATGNVFANWGGACSGTVAKCNVTMNAAKAVTATFNAAVTIPTVITNAASKITTTSATLNGSVISNGATAAVSFDFGVTSAYGTNIVATPSNVFSSTAVAVAANKTGLSCGKTYHYRVKAVNSKGTSYGLNKTFVTTACRRDLVITGLTLAPATPAANGTFSAAVTVKNQGAATSNIGFFLDVWANSTAVPGCGAEGDGWAEIGMLAAGASKTVTVTGLNAGAAGAKTARAFVDSWCEVVESNETNNQLVKTYTVQ